MNEPSCQYSPRLYKSKYATDNQTNKCIACFFTPKILFIDAFGLKDKSRENFKQFYNAVRNIITSLKTIIVFFTLMINKDEECKFQIMTCSSKTSNHEFKLDDYIINETLVHKLDMIFFGIEGNLLPWTKKARKVATFFRMCMKANKPCFASGAGMQFLVYYCATDMLQVEVINGNERGSNLHNINDYTDYMKQKLNQFNSGKTTGIIDLNYSVKINDKIFPNKQNYVFLDHSNGDYYCFKSSEIDNNSCNNEDTSNSTNHCDYDEWIPMGNFGLHNSHYINENNAYRQVKKIKAYKPNKHYIESQEFQVLTSKITDVKCELISKHLGHYLLKDLPLEFLVCSTNLWDAHPVKSTSITGSNSKFTELAESSSGPQIACHGNLVAIQFDICKQNPETITILNNFIAHYLPKIYNNDPTSKELVNEFKDISSTNKLTDLSLALK